VAQPDHTHQFTEPALVKLLASKVTPHFTKWPLNVS
jgi:hypothetical protein